MKLEMNYEIVGLLCDVKVENGQSKLIFNIRKEIEIPEQAIPIEKLNKAVGSRIGIFNCNEDYRLRMANKKQKQIEKII